jgi:protein SCO1
MTRVICCVGLVLALVLPGRAQVVAREYAVTGMVLRVDAVRKSMVVSHERIPDLMDGMTMTFTVSEGKDLEALVPGAIVEFTLVVTRDTAYATRLRVRRYESVEQDPLNARRLGLLSRINGGALQAPALAIGQLVPDFTLTNQVGKPISLSQFRGKVVALTFIYTSCALPQFCLRSANNFGVLQKRFATALGRDLALVTVTFDPLRDRPEVLAQYASQWRADPTTWPFLTGEVSAVRRVCQLFGVDVFSNEGLMDHSVRTAVVDRRGVLVANIEGNQFSATQLGDLVNSVLTASPAGAGR